MSGESAEVVQKKGILKELHESSDDHYLEGDTERFKNENEPLYNDEEIEKIIDAELEVQAQNQFINSNRMKENVKAERPTVEISDEKRQKIDRLVELSRSAGDQELADEIKSILETCKISDDLMKDLENTLKFQADYFEYIQVKRNRAMIKKIVMAIVLVVAMMIFYGWIYPKRPDDTKVFDDQEWGQCKADDPECITQSEFLELYDEE